MAGIAIYPEGLPRPKIVPYAPAIRAGNVIYVSGVLPLDTLDAGGKTVGVGDIRIQTRQVIETISAIVKAAGGTLDDIVLNQIFLRDLADYAGMNEVYKEFFGAAPPARFCIQANLVPPDCLIEISAIAHV
jgi:aminoacrylate peracid reductase